MEPRRTHARKVSFAGASDLEKESMEGSLRRPSGTESVPEMDELTEVPELPSVVQSYR